MKRLFVVGLGPGGRDGMTLEAKKALEQSEVICGYTAYADLIREDYPEKEYLVSGMTKEVERCHMALLAAQDGKTTAMICSGDAGVYGMAGLVLSLAEKYPETEVVIVAGVTAALSGAARLGAPLMNDFAVISLSDLLTPKDDREAAPCGGSGRFFHLSVQSVEQKAGGLFKLGVPDCIRVLCTGYTLWLGADDRKTG